MTPAEREQIRAYVGDDDPTDDRLDELWSLYASVEKVAHVVLVRRLRDLQGDAALEVTFEGDITEDWTENVKALERTVKQLGETVAVGAGAKITTGRLIRRSRR